MTNKKRGYVSQRTLSAKVMKIKNQKWKMKNRSRYFLYGSTGMMVQLALMEPSAD